jgi:hypothetical protein
MPSIVATKSRVAGAWSSAHVEPLQDRQEIKIAALARALL